MRSEYREDRSRAIHPQNTDFFEHSQKGAQKLLYISRTITCYVHSDWMSGICGKFPYLCVSSDLSLLVFWVKNWHDFELRNVLFEWVLVIFSETTPTNLIKFSKNVDDMGTKQTQKTAGENLFESTDFGGWSIDSPPFRQSSPYRLRPPK